MSARSPIIKKPPYQKNINHNELNESKRKIVVAIERQKRHSLNAALKEARINAEYLKRAKRGYSAATIKKLRAKSQANGIQIGISLIKNLILKGTCLNKTKK